MAQHPPLLQLSADNHGPAVIVASLILIIIAFSVVTTRLITRVKVTHKLASDDALIVVSLIFGIAQTASLIVAAKHGLGQHSDSIAPANFSTYAKASYASDILLIPTLASAKASVASLIRALNPPTRTIVCCRITLVVIFLWSLSSILATAFQCRLPEPWNVSGRCINLYAVDVYNTVLNILTDLALVAIPLDLMHGIQLASRKRWLVIGLFASRLIVVAFSIVSISTRRRAFATSGDLTWDLVTSTIWVQGMLAVSIMTACLPSIRRFLSDLKTGMMGVHISEPLERTMRNSCSGSPTSETKSDIQSTLFPSRSANRVSRLSQVKTALVRVEADLEEESPGRELFNPGRNVRSKTTIERSDSVKALTENVILHTIDYEVTYQESATEVVDRRSTRPSLSGY